MQLNLFEIPPSSCDTDSKSYVNPSTNQMRYDLFQAYYDARRNKRNTISQLAFETNYESNLLQLYEEIIMRTYQIKPGVCFINFDPVQREIFAAHFRDRIVHHLIYNYISPIFERIFIHDAYSCRKGKGTSYGIYRINHFIRSCSQNYTCECYILKLDIKGYFMAIHRQLLFEKVKNTLVAFRYRNKDKGSTWNDAFDFEIVMEVLEKIIFNNPITGCMIKGKPSDWDGLPRTKSLFYSPKGCGLPIGNLTSQLFSNIYLNDFDHYMKCILNCRYYGRYVDDFIIVHSSKDYLKLIIPAIRDYLLSNLYLELHPNKIYLQHYTQGVKYLGAVIKPHRMYIANRTKGNFYNAIEKQNKIARDHKPLKEEQKQFISSMNSYLGIMKHFRTYHLRKRMIFKNLSGWWWNHVYLSGGIAKFVLKNKRIDAKIYWPLKRHVGKPLPVMSGKTEG